MRKIKTGSTVLAILFFTVSLYAEISVIKVQGNAAYSTGKSWSILRSGQKLPEGVKVSTGANSYAELRLNSKNHSVTVKPFTMIRVYSKESRNETNTHIGLKRGGITAKVPREGKVKTIFKVSSPIATSSVRGTEENIYYGPSTGMIIEVIKGVVEGSNRVGSSNTLRGRQKFVQIYSRSQALNILSDVRNASIIRIYGNGLTPEEIAAMLYNNDQTGSPDGDTGVLNNQTGKDAYVNVTIGW